MHFGNAAAEPGSMLHFREHVRQEEQLAIA
jgi:hypothetical protein